LVSFIRDAEQYLKFPQFITDFSTFSADEQQRLYNAVMFSNDKVAKSFMAEAMIMAGKTGQMREEAVEALLNDDIFNPGRKSLYEISSLEYALHPIVNRVELTDEEKIGRLYFMHALRGYIPAVAMFQRAMEFVGPNAESANPAVEFDASISSSPLSFNGGEMPEPNWKLVKLLQQQYEKTQEEFARRGITEVELYRGSIYEPGLPLEPWSPIRMVAAIFADGVKWRADFSGSPSPIVRKAKIPVKYFLGTWDTVPNWPEESVLGKKEYMIAGKAFADEGSWEIIDDINEWQNWMKDGTVYY
jgi:hypothetical protein